MSWNDDANVREQYRTSDNLDARSSVWVSPISGPTAHDVALDAVAASRADSILDVGAGRGQLAQRMRDEIGCRVIALDASTAMVTACAERGISSVQGDARHLPFGSDRFDALVAAWMLYHVAPVEQALAEFARVLRPGGVLVAVTNGLEHLEELWRLAKAPRIELPFRRENGEAFLSDFFDHVQRIDVSTTAYFASRESAARYVDSVKLDGAAERLPHHGWPRTMAGATSVFVAHARI